jgi:transposase
MEEISLKVAISKIMDLKDPWFIEAVEINKKTLTIDVFIDFFRGNNFECSECSKPSKVHDTSTKRARHLDFLEYRCYLNYTVPRTKCEKHGVKTINNLPFLRKGSHFSFFLNEE